MKLEPVAIQFSRRKMLISIIILGGLGGIGLWFGLLNEESLRRITENFPVRYQRLYGLTFGSILTLGAVSFIPKLFWKGPGLIAIRAPTHVFTRAER